MMSPFEILLPMTFCNGEIFFSLDCYLHVLQSQPELILTFLGAKYSRIEEEMVVNEVEGVPNGFVPHLAVCEKITGKEASLQR